jgi:hypothetical protein
MISARAAQLVVAYVKWAVKLALCVAFIEWQANLARIASEVDALQVVGLKATGKNLGRFACRHKPDLTPIGTNNGIADSNRYHRTG